MSSELDWLDSLQGSGIRPGLTRMRAVLRALGNPHRKVPAIVVAGTNGKGSTSAMIASILTQSGYRTAHYTSPHLVDLRERWTVDGEMITPAELDDAIRALQTAAGKSGITPTYFEALTLIAFVVFARAKCDVSVLEVGMGGRLDATNVVSPLASVITPVSIDHTEYLGNTLRKIAREKAGIIHRGSIVVTSNHDPVVLQVIRRRASKFGNRLVLARTRDRDALPAIPLAGAFQWENAALAVRTVEELAPRFPKIRSESIARGIEKTRWRGRLERFLIAGRDVWVDGCHNRHAIEAVIPFIESTLPRPRLLVFGMMADKDFKDAIGRLFPRFDRVIATEPFPPRSLTTRRIAELAAKLQVPCEQEPDAAAALRRALGSDAASIFVGGSLYLAGSAIALFDELRS